MSLGIFQWKSNFLTQGSLCMIKSQTGGCPRYEIYASCLYSLLDYEESHFRLVRLAWCEKTMRKNWTQCLEKPLPIGTSLILDIHVMVWGRTNFYIWWCFICIQVSFGNWGTNLKKTWNFGPRWSHVRILIYVLSVPCCHAAVKTRYPLTSISTWPYCGLGAYRGRILFWSWLLSSHWFSVGSWAQATLLLQGRRRGSAQRWNFCSNEPGTLFTFLLRYSLYYRLLDSTAS